MQTICLIYTSLDRIDTFHTAVHFSWHRNGIIWIKVGADSEER